ncbi:hypothetical protein GCM10027036_03210 [Flavihumibacter cheonanensis]|uniref:DUF4365 domain-containing protein n=1 Tax=Flavihumibacter cheonanensis TaxID=1442385 RepID=UPI001EF8717E|nr:DUF4365 domain-containing protein [Flavihumibacter cheonanensis]MCG7752235.1 DUF4365 domain-containing protein [Flavihumibacter cheonanensis]
MAYNDLPIVDRSAANCERSVQQLKRFLNMQSGFILREDIPDYGCDFDAELVLEDGRASNQRFPIQIKSVAKLKLIGDGRFITYSFETSRLGYLMRRMPTGGIIAIYSEDQEECYFEYCDRIFQRITEEKLFNDWQSQAQVNIHIPVSNKLTSVAAKELHHTFKNRFVQAAMMQNSMGLSYGLPSVLSDNPTPYDFNNIDQLKMFLRKHGILLFNKHDIHIIYGLISRIPLIELYGNKELLLMAAVAYGETGMHVESRMFASKLSKHELTEEMKLILRFVEMKNDLSLGYLDRDKFIQELEELLKTAIDDENKITIEINLIYFKLTKKQALEPLPPDILLHIDKVFAEIEQLSVSNRKKALLLLWNAENLSCLITMIGADSLSSFAIRESMNGKVLLTEREAATTNLVALENRFNNLLRRINKEAVSNSDKVLNAHIFSLDVKHFIFSQINYVSLDVPVHTMGRFPERILGKIAIAENTCNAFTQLNMPNYAYENLCNMIDLVELAEEGYNIATPYDKKVLYDTKEKFEALQCVSSRPLIFSGMIARKKQAQENLDTENAMVLKDLNDTQLETLARSTLHSLGLPEDCLPYLLHEMISYRLFYQRCTNADIEVITEQNFINPYTKKSRFILRNKTTGIFSAPHSDLDTLLTTWGL